MIKKTFLASFLSLTIFFALGAGIVFSQEEEGSFPVEEKGGFPVEEKGSNPGDTTLKNPFRGGQNSLFGLLKTIINDILMPIGGVLAVLAFIYSGFLYVTARGNQTKIDTAHKALLYTAIGTAVILGAWVFATVICQTIGQLGGPVCPA